MRAVFAVLLDIPEGADHEDAKTYIENAVRIHCGGLDPADPMFSLNRETVEVHQDEPTLCFCGQEAVCEVCENCPTHCNCLEEEEVSA